MSWLAVKTTIREARIEGPQALDGALPLKIFELELGQPDVRFVTVGDRDGAFRVRDPGGHRWPRSAISDKRASLNIRCSSQMMICIVLRLLLNAPVGIPRRDPPPDEGHCSTRNRPLRELPTTKGVGLRHRS